MVKKAVFGGTFDPIHFGHLHLAYAALEEVHMDKVIFVPTGNPPHKTKKQVTDAQIRYEMVKLAVRNEERFDISDFEVRNTGLSYTYKTLQHFKELEPDTDWYLITGLDCLMELESWKNVDKILEISNLIVFNRMGYKSNDVLIQKQKIEKKYNKSVSIIDVNILEISSTDIRNRVKCGRNIDYLVPQGIDNIIKELHLYTARL